MTLELGLVLWGGQKFDRFTSIWNSSKVFQKLIIFCPRQKKIIPCTFCYFHFPERERERGRGRERRERGDRGEKER
jgi:hypothetical protein